TNSACCSLDQYSLSRGQATMVEKCPPGCHRADRECGGLNKTQGLRFERESLDRYRDILGICSCCDPSKDGLADLACSHTRTKLCNYSCQFDTRGKGKRHRLEILHQALTDFQIYWVHPSRVDTHKHFAR